MKKCNHMICLIIYDSTSNLKTKSSDWSSWSACSCEGTSSRTRACSVMPTDGSLSETLEETESCSPEERIWYGETKIATVSNDAGIWDGNFVLSNMFDSDATTSWHSAYINVGRIKIITIDFLVRTNNNSICRT